MDIFPSNEWRFKGGTYLGNQEEYDHSHVAMTYTALLTLQTLGDDLSRINRESILSSLQSLQQPNGSFQCTTQGSENDLRFLYCACAISYILKDWSGVNISKAIEFVKSCISYDGAFVLYPGCEGHGGSTFCAVASLVLMDRVDVLDRKRLVYWCVNRQCHSKSAGMQGRPNKDEDTCYSYWIGGTLELLNSTNYINTTRLKNYVLSCQTFHGKFNFFHR